MTSQEIQFEMIKMSPYFKDKADIIINTLIENSELWDCFIVDSDSNLDKLVNIATQWNANTIYIQTHTDTSIIEDLISDWTPSAWEWVEKDQHFLNIADIESNIIKIWF